MNATESNTDMSRLRHIWEQLGQVIDGPSGCSFEGKANGSPKVFGKSADNDGELTLALATEIYRFRRKRAEFFNNDLFADPGWDILLELYRLRLEGRRASVKSICIASEVPSTTALRWINILIAQGLLHRTNDAHDHRVRWISLSDSGYTSMRDLLQSALNSEGSRHGDVPVCAAQGGSR